MKITSSAYVFLVLLWLAGIATVKGFWITVLAIIPPFGWYFAVEAYLVPVLNKLVTLL